MRCGLPVSAEMQLHNPAARTPPGPALGMWPATAQGLGLQAFLSLLYMSHHIGSLSSRLDCPSCEEDLAGGPQGAPSLS